MARRGNGVRVLGTGVAGVLAIMLAASCRGWRAAPATTDSPGSGIRRVPGEPVRGSRLLGPVHMSEQHLREMAIASPPPAYPVASLERGSAGVAVAAIRGRADGRIESVEILQAPDADIGASVREALKQWTFKPARVDGAPDATHLFAVGKVTFYFQIVNGVGQIAAPSAPPVHKAGAAPAVDETPAARLADIRARELVQLVDVRDRSDFEWQHQEGAVGIPFDELPARAPKELDRGKRILVDCTKEPQDWCRAGASTLRELGFANAGVLVR